MSPGCQGGDQPMRSLGTDNVILEPMRVLKKGNGHQADTQTNRHVDSFGSYNNFLMFC